MSKSPEDTTPTPADIDLNSIDGYEEFDIGIIPTIKSVGGFTSEAPPEGSDGGFNPPPIQGAEFSGTGEVTTLEECESLSRMLWNTPGMLMGDHLTRSDEQIKLYGKELYLYCSKKGIDPRDYVGDWMPLAVLTGTMGIGMFKDHKAYKKDKAASAGLNKPTPTFDTGKGVTSSGVTKEFVPPDQKLNLNPASSSGGDDIATSETME